MRTNATATAGADASIMGLAPERAVALLCVAQLVIWTLVPAVFARAMPVDVIEGYAWGREWVIGSYKHPGLPGWLLEASRLATGQTGWPAFLISQVFVTATFALVFLLGRDLMGPARGAAAAMLLTGVYFFSWSTTEFNHSIAQMPFWVGLVWAVWRAVERGSVGWWLLAGLLAGVGMYAKLSTALIVGIAGLWLLSDRRGRAALSRPGPWLGLLLAAFLVLPLTQWLVATDASAVRYTSERSHERLSGLALVSANLGFIGMQLLCHTALLLVLMWAGWRTRVDAGSDYVIDPRAKRFILFMALGPVLATLIAAFGLGIWLRPTWGSGFATMSGLLAMALCSARVTAIGLKRAAIAAVMLLVLVPAGYVADLLLGSRRPVAPQLQSFKQQRANWPQKAITDHLVAAWTTATGRPLRIVIGEMRVAGLVALDAPSRPSVLELDFWKSPWITPERLAAEGALLVWSEPGGIPSESITERFAPGRPIVRVTFPWPRAPTREPLKIGYVIVPPRQ